MFDRLEAFCNAVTQALAPTNPLDFLSEPSMDVVNQPVCWPALLAATDNR